MIRTIAGVARGEGLRSVVSRAGERLREGAAQQLRLARGLFTPRPQPQLANVFPALPSPRIGGVEAQLQLRLGEERRLREVALYYPGILQSGSCSWREHFAAVNARGIVLEGAFHSLPAIATSADVILVIHDFSLLSAKAHELEIDDRKLSALQELLGRVRATIFPSMWLLNAYRPFLPRGGNAHVIEPGIAEVALKSAGGRHRVAIVGSVKHHKGGALIPSLVRATPEVEWHLFGGGDVELLRAVRSLPSVRVHGYYRSGALPHLLARESIGLAIVPSIVPESFSLTLSECWSAQVPVIAFDHGAIAERIRAHGGGFLVTPEAGWEGIVSRIHEWQGGALVTTPSHVPTAREAAAAHVALYRSLGLC